MEKSILQALLKLDDMEAAAAGLLERAEKTGDADLRAAAIQLAARLEDWKKDRDTGGVSPERLTEKRNAIRPVAIELVEKLVDSADKNPAARPVGMLESRFKNVVFWAMLAGNLAAWVCLFVLGQEAGTFTPSETMTTFSLLLSPLAAYFSVMFSDLIASRGGDEKPSVRRVGTRFQWVSMLVLAAYFFLVCFLMLYRSQIEFSEFTSRLALLEGALGVFVAQVINALFKKAEKPM